MPGDRGPSRGMIGEQRAPWLPTQSVEEDECKESDVRGVCQTQRCTFQVHVHLGIKGLLSFCHENGTRPDRRMNQSRIEKPPRR
ncbi:unnamed protein product [Lampetra planeri]